MFEQQAVENTFLRDVGALRTGAVCLLNDHSFGEREISIGLLQSVVSAEILCVLRYTMISVSPDGLRNALIGAEFDQQAKDEREHMMMAAARIEALGGKPNFDFGRLAAGLPGHRNFEQLVAENLAAERSVIEHYRDLLKYFAMRDQESCAMLEEIIRDEEEHFSDMRDILGEHFS